MMWFCLTTQTLFFLWTQSFYTVPASSRMCQTPFPDSPETWSWQHHRQITQTWNVCAHHSTQFCCSPNVLSAWTFLEDCQLHSDMLSYDPRNWWLLHSESGGLHMRCSPLLMSSMSLHTASTLGSRVPKRIAPIPRQMHKNHRQKASRAAFIHPLRRRLLPFLRSGSECWW